MNNVRTLLVRAAPFLGKSVIVLVTMFLFSISQAEDDFKSFRFGENYEVYGAKHLPEQPQAAKGVLILSHGLFSHSDRYIPFARKLSSQGFIVYRYDFRGHGRTARKHERGHVDSFDELIADLSELTNIAKTRHPELPLYLFGHSTGGLVTFLHAARSSAVDEIDGLILSAPAFNILVPEGKEWKVPAGKFISLIHEAIPILKIYTGEKTERGKLTDHPDTLKKLNSDPVMLNDFTYPLGGGLFLSAGKALDVDLSKVKLPRVLFIQGLRDGVVSPEKNLEYAEKLLQSGVDVEIRTHNVLHEPLASEPEVRALVEDQIIDFMNNF